MFMLTGMTSRSSSGFGPAELRRIERKIEQDETFLMEKWNERFGSWTR
jgi:hypothetical protein